MMKYLDNDIIELGGDLQVAITYKNLLAKIATYIYVTTANETSTCAWCTYFDEIEETFGLEPGWIDEEIAEDIQDTLNTYFAEFIAEIEIIYNRGENHEEVDRYFDITLYTNYCVGILQDDCSVEYSL